MKTVKGDLKIILGAGLYGLYSAVKIAQNIHGGGIFLIRY